MNKFPKQSDCIAYLERIRWRGTPLCPRCESDKVARKQDRGRVGEWNCHSCKSTFNVMTGTIFQGTQVALQKWFLAIVLMVHAKKSISSTQLARDLEITQPTAWAMQQRIRTEMENTPSVLLQGIIEADETFIGGKPRRRKDDDGNLPPPTKRGRGTKKTKVLGAVQRGGKVVARVVTDLSGATIMKFITSFIRGGSTLMTDEYKGYKPVKRVMKHKVIKHSEYRYVDNEVHTNTIEGFWSLVKRAWYGTHHHYSKKYTHLYIAESCWKYNNRDVDDLFELFLRQCLAH